jgi:hypothetical protein
MRSEADEIELWQGQNAAQIDKFGNRQRKQRKATVVSVPRISQILLSFFLCFIYSNASDCPVVLFRVTVLSISALTASLVHHLRT